MVFKTPYSFQEKLSATNCLVHLALSEVQGLGQGALLEGVHSQQHALPLAACPGARTGNVQALVTVSLPDGVIDTGAIARPSPLPRGHTENSEPIRKDALGEVPLGWQQHEVVKSRILLEDDHVSDCCLERFILTQVSHIEGLMRLTWEPPLPPTSCNTRTTPHPPSF